MKKYRKPRNHLIFYVLLLLISLISSLYSGNYILWVCFFFLISIFILDGICFLFHPKKIKIKQTLSTKLTECYSEIILMVETLQKNTNFYVSYQNSGKTFYTPVYKSCAIPIKLSKIGFRHVSIDNVFIRTPFGIFNFLIDIKENPELTCFVMPIIRTIQLDEKTEKIQLPPHRNLFNNNTEFVGNREYNMGDPLKYINFKKSAAMKKTMVKEYKNTENTVVYGIFIEEFDEEQKEIVVESTLACNELFMSLGGDLLYVTMFDGFEQKYEIEDISRLPYDLAAHNYTETKIKSKIFTFPTVLIITKYEKERDFAFVSDMPENSIVFLVGEAQKHRETILEIIREVNVFILDETKLIKEGN